MKSFKPRTALVSWLIQTCLTTVGEASSSSSPLTGGVVFHKDLQRGEVVCYTMGVPLLVEFVNVEASVVGLTGNPNIFGGFDERQVLQEVQSSLAPVSSGGYHILSETLLVPSDSDKYYVCVTTFATQGSDFVLSGSVTDAYGWYSHPIALMDSYPIVWRLDENSHFVDYSLSIKPGSKSLVVSLTPFSGNVDVRVFEDCAGGSSMNMLAVSAVVGPDILSIPLLRAEGTLIESVCVRVHRSEEGELASSEFSLVATTDVERGPFVAQSIPVAGLVGVLDRFRAYFIRDTDVLLESRGDVKYLKASLGWEQLYQSPSSPMWESRSPLNIPRSLLAELRSDNDVLYIAVTGGESATFADLSGETVDPNNSPASRGSILVSVTTFSTVEQIEDGVPISVVADSESRRFKDFRFYIPTGVALLTIQGDSSEDGSGLGIFASTTRTSHDPRGYTWNTMESSNEIIFVSDENVREKLDISRKSVQSLPCTDCYMYISVKSCVVRGSACSELGVSRYSLLVSTDGGVTTLDSDRSVVEPIVGRKVFYFKESNVRSNVRYFVIPSAEVVVALSDSAPTDGENKAGRKCAAKERCMVVGGAKFLTVTTDNQNEPALVEVVAVQGAQMLRNHHAVVGAVMEASTVLPGEENFAFAVPLHAENAMLHVQGTARVRVCKKGECEEIGGTGVVYLKKPGDNKGNTPLLVHIQVVPTNSDHFSIFSITPSFYSSSNSLRVGYKPVSVAVAPNQKVEWQVGYYDRAEWLVVAEFAQSNDGNGLSLCLDSTAASDAAPRCCGVPCTLQGFDREIVWLENRDGTDSVTATLTTESLSLLVEDRGVGMEGRKSPWFKVPSAGRLVVENGGSVKYFLRPPVGYSPASGQGEGLTLPPATAVSYALVEGADAVTLQLRHPLTLNRWNDNTPWNAWDNVPEGSIIRVEKCSDGDLAVVYSDGNQKTGESFPLYLDTPVRASGELTISGSDRTKFRTALFDPDRKISISVGDEYLSFVAPPNAGNSVYRSICLPRGLEPSTVSQCILERSPETLKSAGIACEPSTLCFVPFDKALCGTFASVVADKGVAYGMFSPVRLGESDFLQFDSDDVSSHWMPSLWRIALWTALIYVMLQYLQRHQVWFRMQLGRLLNFLSRRKKDSTQLELNLMENGGYRAMGDDQRRLPMEMTNRNTLHGRNRI